MRALDPIRSIFERASLIEMIDKATLAGAPYSSWEIGRMSPGQIDVKENSRHAEEYFLVWVGNTAENKDSVVIGQAYRTTPQPTSAAVQPMLLPRSSPFFLSELRRLPD